MVSEGCILQSKPEIRSFESPIAELTEKEMAPLSSLDKLQPTTTSAEMSTQMFPERNYRGLTIEDLEIKPAVSINPNTTLAEALEIAYENDFTFLPVIDHTNRKLLGVLDMGKIKEQIKDGGDILNPYTRYHMRWFHQKARETFEEKHPQSLKASHRTTLTGTIMCPHTSGSYSYRVLTPYTPLEDLADFFNSGEYFAIITNPRGTFVYGVATPDDLLKYQKRRPNL